MEGEARATAEGRPTKDRAIVEILADAARVAARAASLLTGWVADAIERQGEAHVALTGGSSASGLYAELRRPSRRGAVDWTRVHFWWGDERFVPLDHPDSNAGLANRLLLDSGIDEAVEREILPVPADHVHPMPIRAAIAAGDGPAGAATRYAAELGAVVTQWRDGMPAFDVVLLGMGPDGHLLSVFPGSPALDPEALLVMGLPAPEHVKPHRERVTLSPGILAAADHVLMMVSGTPKATTVRQVLEGERDPLRWPAQLAVRPNAIWLLDRAAASQIDRGGDVAPQAVQA